MRSHTALYVGNDCQMQGRLDGYLQSFGIALRKVSSIPVAKKKLCEHECDLLLIRFEPVCRKYIFDFCRYVRHEYYETVILVLMARAMPIIESKLFECGADDIVAGKQTLPAALRSRIKRRLANRELFSSPEANKIMLKNGALVDLGRKEVRVNGFCHKLNGISEKLLQYFLSNPYRAISREELIKSHIWDNSVCSPDKVEGGRAVDIAVTRLRRIIEPYPHSPQIITTVHGTGWMLAEDAVIRAKKYLPDNQNHYHDSSRLVPELRHRNNATRDTVDLYSRKCY